MLAKVFSAAVVGLTSVLIEVEVDVAAMGFPGFTIVGLPEKSIEESKERVRAAIKNAGADFPAKRITVNLAPANIPKEGTHYDLPIAIGVLIATGQTPNIFEKSILAGELALDGTVRSVSGILPMAFLAKESEFESLYIPEANASEASLLYRYASTNEAMACAIMPVKSLLQLSNHAAKVEPIVPYTADLAIAPEFTVVRSEVDMADVKGQEQAKRALTIAAAGGHNISLRGTPGTGKTMLAKALASIMPKATAEEALEITKIYSVSGLLGQDGDPGLQRPFRSPHHTISQVGLVGGGPKPKPGEISLAHRGILFLDEFPQFSRSAIEALRAPLEDGRTTIVRANSAVTFPSKFLLVTAENPCPCGNLGDEAKACVCTPQQIARYQHRISGPILDRIDLHVNVPRLEVNKLMQTETSGESSAVIQIHVQQARDMQHKRFVETPIRCNAEMTPAQIKQFCLLDKESEELLQLAITKMHLSARAYHRVLKVARTIADLAQSETIEKEHIAEAVSYRQRAEK